MRVGASACSRAYCATARREAQRPGSRSNDPLAGPVDHGTCCLGEARGCRRRDLGRVRRKPQDVRAPERLRGPDPGRRPGRQHETVTGSAGEIQTLVDVIEGDAMMMNGGRRRSRPVPNVVHGRVPTTFVLRYTLRASRLELGGVDLDLAVEDDVLPLDRADMTQQIGVEREVRRGGQP